MFYVTDDRVPFYPVLAFPYEVIYDTIGFLNHLFVHDQWNYEGFNNLDYADNSKISPFPQF